MRVISGKYRSRILKSLENDKTRPTLDRVKEAVFSSLYDINDKVFLDLFSGSGSIGIEALSRGARKVVFNEIDKNALNIIKKNIANLNISEEYELHNLDYRRCLKNLNMKFDIIYVDPPYAAKYYQEVIDEINDLNLLSADGIIVLESEKNISLDLKQYNIIKSVSYGRIKITYLRRK